MESLLHVSILTFFWVLWFQSSHNWALIIKEINNSQKVTPPHGDWNLCYKNNLEIIFSVREKDIT